MTKAAHAAMPRGLSGLDAWWHRAGNQRLLEVTYAGGPRMLQLRRLCGTTVELSRGKSIGLLAEADKSNFTGY
jgi:hypothetical protein